MPHVVVVGAGFGGIAATDELSKEGFRVTLLDRFPYNTFQPLLYQVATGGLNPGDVTYALRFFAARHEGVRFRCAESSPSTMISMKLSVTTASGSASTIW